VFKIQEFWSNIINSKKINLYSKQKLQKLENIVMRKFKEETNMKAGCQGICKRGNIGLREFSKKSIEIAKKALNYKSRNVKNRIFKEKVMRISNSKKSNQKVDSGVSI